ncbi:MAG: ROK family protein, partial [Opitutaceae bacterium]|nr:ROK family protein [Opitutaceae bacterium]
FATAGNLLGQTLLPLIAELRPTRVIIGGQISKAFDLFGPALRQAAADTTHPPLILPALNPDTAPLLGAASVFSNS